MIRLAILLCASLLFGACVMEVDEDQVADTSSTTAQAEGGAPSTGQSGAAAPAATSIPGVTLDDIIKTFEQQGFKCNDIGNETTVAWTCDRPETTFGHTVQAYGAAKDALKQIKFESIAFGVDASDIAKPFLLKAADIAYTGADPDALRAFINENLGKEAETVIGGVTVRMRATGEMRTLYLEV